MDTARAASILADDTYLTEVREREKLYISQGINSVPSVIFNGKHLIQGGQPAAVFEQAIRRIAADA